MFRFTTGAGVLAGAALLVAGLAAAPAGAGVEWSDPQEVSSRYGWQVSLSGDGQMAAWIRVGKRPGPGPAHTSKYLGDKKGWSKSKPVPGSAEATEVVLAADGNTLLVKVPTGYGVSSRSGSSNRWSSVKAITEGRTVELSGRLSADGGTVVWIKLPEAPPNVFPFPAPRLVTRSRAADGSWTAPVELGETAIPYRAPQLALSADADTVAWLANAQVLAVTRAASGAWSAPTGVQGVANSSEVGSLQLSGNGSRMVWRSGKSSVLTSTRTATGWAPVTYVMQNDVSSVSMSPNGKVVAYGQVDPDRLRVRRYASGQWTSPKTLGPSVPQERFAPYQPATQIVVRNKAVAWVEDSSNASKLWVSLLRKGTWGKAVKVAPKAQSPALSSKGDTLAWAGTGVGKIFSVTR